MTARDLSNSDFAGLEHSHRQRLQERRWSELDDQEAEMPCGRLEDFFMTWGSISALVLIVALVVWFFGRG